MSGMGGTGINFTSRTQNVPPFPATAADNGLSVDAVTGRIVLGDDFGVIGGPGRLLNSRFLDLNGFELDMVGLNLSVAFQDNINTVIISNTFGNLTFDPVLSQVQLLSFIAPAGLILDNALSLTDIGDVQGNISDFVFRIDGNLGRATALNTTTTNRFFDINPVAQLYSMGDVDQSSGGLRMIMDDATGVIAINNVALNAALSINGVAGFTGTVLPPLTITVDGGIVTNVA